MVGGEGSAKEGGGGFCSFYLRRAFDWVGLGWVDFEVGLSVGF